MDETELKSDETDLKSDETELKCDGKEETDSPSRSNEELPDVLTTDVNETPSGERNESPSEDRDNLGVKSTEGAEDIAAVPVDVPKNDAEADASTAAQEVDSPEEEKSGSARLENKTRTSSHSKLRAYESRRRSAYSSKLSSSSLYWRSFRDLLHHSYDETERAESIVRGSAAANQMYALSMRAAAEDSLDDVTGKPVTDVRRKKKLFEMRERRRFSTVEGHPPSDAKGKHKSRLHVSDKSFDSDSRTNLIHTLIDCHTVMADRFGENATYVKDELLPDLTALKVELAKEVSIMEKLGDCLLDELEGAETDVIDAWDSYYFMATKSLSGSGSSNETRRQRATTTAERDILDNYTDVWIVEMHYRMSVAYLSTCWEKCSVELSKLFASMKETECSRRFRLREILVLFLQRQERLWLSIPPALTPVLNDLVDRNMDRTSIEDDVQNSIRVRAQSIQREEQTLKRGSSNNNRDLSGSGLTGVDSSLGEFELSSPLVSDLLCKVNVIEKKTGGYMSSWKTTLAVLTADSFLHLFELPSNVPVQSGSASEVAFYNLTPPVDVPTEEIIKAGKTWAGSKPWFEHLTPAESLVLPNCTFSFQDEKGNLTFEITETLVASGASKMFSKTTSRKLYLRTVSREETLTWVQALQAFK